MSDDYVAPLSRMNHIVIYSGGMDSFTLLHWVLKNRAFPLHPNESAPRSIHTLRAISFNYNQRHVKELLMAEKVCHQMGIAREVIFLPALRLIAKGSALTDHRVSVPHGHYAAESMKQTVVPGRNTVMLAMALAFAEGLSLEDRATIYYGAHAGDHHIYPDCRPEFVAAMRDTIYAASGGRVTLEAPFLNISKSDILTEGLKLGLAPSYYMNTWSCYEGRDYPCNACGACVERAEAFDKNMVIDPLSPK